MARQKAEPNVAQTPGRITASAVDVIEAYKKIFSTAEGGIVLADLMRHFGFTMNSTYVDGSPNGIYLNEGARRVLIHIGRRLDTDPASVEATENTEM